MQFILRLLYLVYLINIELDLSKLAELTKVVHLLDESVSITTEFMGNQAVCTDMIFEW